MGAVNRTTRTPISSRQSLRRSRTCASAVPTTGRLVRRTSRNCSAPTYRRARDGSTDPCADLVISATDYGCLAQGIHIGQKTPSNPSEQYNGLLGGNPDLVPEKATTKTVGVVLQPRFIPRFAFTSTIGTST